MSTEIFDGAMFLQYLAHRRDQIILRQKEAVQDFVNKQLSDDSNADADEQLLTEEVRLLKNNLKLIELLMDSTREHVERSQKRALKEMRDRPPVPAPQPVPEPVTKESAPPSQPRRQPRFTRVPTARVLHRAHPEAISSSFSSSVVNCNCSLAVADPPRQWSGRNDLVPFSDLPLVPMFHAVKDESTGGWW